MGKKCAIVCALFMMTAALHAIELPDVGKDEVLFLVASERHIQQFKAVENFSSKLCPGGACFGSEQINWAIFTRVVFIESGPPDNPAKILEKLEYAVIEGKEVVVYGYKNPAELISFCQRMGFIKILAQKLQIEAFKNGFRVNKESVDHAFDFLKNKVGFSSRAQMVGIKPLMNPNTAHALTVVGYTESIRHDYVGMNPHTFWVIDSNHPEKLSKLRAIGNKVQSGWVYEPWVGLHGQGHVLLNFIDSPKPRVVEFSHPERIHERRFIRFGDPQKQRAFERAVTKMSGGLYENACFNLEWYVLRSIMDLWIR